MFFKRKKELKPGMKYEVKKVVKKDNEEPHSNVYVENGHTYVKLDKMPQRQEYHGSVKLTDEEEDDLKKRINWILGEEQPEPKKPEPVRDLGIDLDINLRIPPEDEQRLKEDLAELRRLDLIPYSMDRNWRRVATGGLGLWRVFPYKTIQEKQRKRNAYIWAQDHESFMYDLDLLALKIQYGYYGEGAYLSQKTVQKMMDAHSLNITLSPIEVMSIWVEQCNWRRFDQRKSRG